MARIAVMGAGSWGTTMAKVCAEAGNSVTLWARRRDAAELIARTHRNERYLPGIDLPRSLTVTHDDAAALQDAEIIILGVPSSTVRANLARWADILDPLPTPRSETPHDAEGDVEGQTAAAAVNVSHAGERGHLTDAVHPARTGETAHAADVADRAHTVNAGDASNSHSAAWNRAASALAAAASAVTAGRGNTVGRTVTTGRTDTAARATSTPASVGGTDRASTAGAGKTRPSALWGGATTLAGATDKPLLVSLAKGLEKSTLLRMSQVMAEVTGWPADNLAVLTGPNLAKEIAQQQPAATVVACENLDAARFIQEAIATPYFRPYTNTDVVGCEIAGVSKNVIALAAGMASGRGLGHNTAATIITRGLAEATRLGVKLGASERTFSGLAGLGDLVATCSSPLSRNRTFGERLGQGMTLAEAREACKGQVAEGVSSCTSLVRLAQNYGVEVPIAQAVSAVCHDGHDVGESISRLMQRAKKSE